MRHQRLTRALGYWHGISPRSPIYHPPERGHSPDPPTYQAYDTPTDNGHEEPGDPGTVNMVHTAAGLAGGCLDYRDMHRHLALAKHNTAPGEDGPAGFN